MLLATSIVSGALIDVNTLYRFEWIHERISPLLIRAADRSCWPYHLEASIAHKAYLLFKYQ